MSATTELEGRPPSEIQRSARTTDRSVLIGALALALIGLASGACRSRPEQSRWEEEILEAQSLHDDEEFDRAERRYHDLLSEAEAPRDRRYVRLQLARLAADRGAYERALEGYRELWNEEVDDSYGSRAMTEAAHLLEEELARPDRARDLRRRLIRDHPASTGAERALETLADQLARRGEFERLRREFSDIYSDVEDTALSDDVLFHAGLALERRAGRIDDALEYYHRVIDEHPDGDMTDDAEWRAGSIYVRRQHWRQVDRVFGRLARRVDASWMIGSFNSPYASKARFRLGRIHMTHLDDYDEAIRHFDRYLRDFPRNRHADDAAWHRAQAQRLAGRTDAYRESLRKFVRDFPESRYVRRAREALDEIDSSRQNESSR